MPDKFENATLWLWIDTLTRVEQFENNIFFVLVWAENFL